MNTDALQRIILRVAQSQSVYSVMQMIVRGLAEQPDVALTRIWLCSVGDLCTSCYMREMCPDQTRCLHLVASAGHSIVENGTGENALGHWTGIDGHFRRIPLNSPLKVGYVGGKGEPVLIRIDPAAENQKWIARPEWVRAEEIRSFAGQPLIFKGQVLGVLAIFSRAEMDEREFEWLGTFADHAAVAIANTQATEQITALNASATATAERYRSLLEVNNAIITNLTEEGLLRSISQALRRIISFDRCAITLFKPERGTLRFLAVEGYLVSDYFQVGLEVEPSETSAGWVFDHQRPLVRRDLEKEQEFPNERRLCEEGIRSIAVAPLIFLGKSVGTLSVVSKNTNQYSEADAQFLQEVANQVALAIENMKAYEEIGALNTTVVNTAERLRTLLEINNAIITKLTQTELFHAICEVVKRVVPFDRVSLILHERSSDELRIVAMEGPFVGQFFAVGHTLGRESLVRWVFDHQRPLLRKDLESERHYPTEDLSYQEGIRCMCGLPLIVREKPIGVLFVASLTCRQYSDADVSFLQEVSNQIALATANMRSHEEITLLSAREARTARQSRTLLEINNAIITNLSQEALLHAVAEALRQVVPFDRAALTLYIPERDAFQYLAVESRFNSEHFRAGLEFDRKASVAGWVFEHQVAIMRCDLEKEQSFPNDRRLVEEGLRSDCVVPLIVGGNSIGTFNVGSTTKNKFSEGDMGFLQEVGNQVALAVANMKSYEEIAGLKAKLEEENIYLQEEIRREHNFDEIVGNSPTLLELLRQVEQVAPTDSSVMISGETGTGKELIARAIHSRSARAARPLVKVNCGAIPAGLVESELFGHVKGAFTGALTNRIGRFELANGGTIFLDEVGELPLETQVKLLRVLQEQEFEPLGSNHTVRVDVRIIAATNRDLDEDVKAGRFRSDVYYRLNVVPLMVPPLRERGADIPQLALFFMDRFSRKFGKKLNAVPQGMMDRLKNYAWPGNIRELQNVIERAVVLSRGSTLKLDSGFEPVPVPGSDTPMPASLAPEAALATEKISDFPTLEEVERGHILVALKQSDWVIEGAKGAARILKLHPNTLRHRMGKLGIKRSAHHPS